MGVILKRLSALVLLGGALFAATQFEDIRDWWWLRNYQPSAQIQALADRAGMSEAGRRSFYLGRPQVDDKLNFQQHCPVGEAEGSLVLGCYSQRQIYILDVQRPELVQVMEVTAAHEMLHAAYERLGEDERDRIDRQLEQFYAQVANPELAQILTDYEQTEPGQRLNELHSLLPTQITNLSPELETYYARYFTNQDQVASAYLAYQGVFKNLQAQIDSLSTDIDSLRDEISELEEAIEARRGQIDSQGEELDNLRDSGRTEEYNAQVPAYNASVREYNGLISRYRDLIALHNSKVDQLNQLALEQNELVNSLNSKFTPL